MSVRSWKRWIAWISVGNTLIVITSDNGAYSWVGSNGIYRGQKGDLFEGGHRVPAVFNWPGRISEGEVSDATTMTMDLAPTFAALAGLEESDSKRFDGIDLSELLFDNAPVPVRTLFWRFNNSYTGTHARSVREGKWKYVLEKDVSYLFDLDKDPAEEQNLASDYPDRVRDMDHAFLAWEKETRSRGECSVITKLTITAAAAAFALTAFSANADNPEPSGEKPNIVLILADDLGYADIGAYGNKLNRTPHLDRLAREGLRFTDFHSNAANCSPTRAAILTGQYQQRCGIDEGAFGEGAKGLPQDVITIAERLHGAGYATGLMGKWHLGYEPANGPTRHGFDEFVGHLHGATDYLSRVDRYGRRDWWHNEKAFHERSQHHAHHETFGSLHQGASGQAVLSLCFTLRDPFSLADDNRQSTPRSR